MNFEGIIYQRLRAKVRKSCSLPHKGVEKMKNEKEAALRLTQQKQPLELKRMSSHGLNWNFKYDLSETNEENRENFPQQTMENNERQTASGNDWVIILQIL